MAQFDGILSEPLDIDAPTGRRRVFPKVGARAGLALTHRPSGVSGAVLKLHNTAVMIRDHEGRDHSFHLIEGGFTVDGKQVSLEAPGKVAPGEQPTTRTASGSRSVGAIPARVARASRILVEGVHDAELVEKVWGDDLRVEGIVVEPIGGMDDLGEIVRTFGPRSGRRLGILLDHLVDGTKESRMAARIDHPDVLICGHPYVDVWQAIKPSVVGIREWPVIPMGTPWKEGMCEALGVASTTDFWRRIRNKVNTYADLEPPLVGAVEQLIDFVTVESS